MLTDSVIIVVQKDGGEYRFRMFQNEQCAIESVAEMSKAKTARVDNIFTLDHTGAVHNMEIGMVNGRLMLTHLIVEHDKQGLNQKQQLTF